MQLRLHCDLACLTVTSTDRPCFSVTVPSASPQQYMIHAACYTKRSGSASCCSLPYPAVDENECPVQDAKCLLVDHNQQPPKPSPTPPHPAACAWLGPRRQSQCTPPRARQTDAALIHWLAWKGTKSAGERACAQTTAAARAPDKARRLAVCALHAQSMHTCSCRTGQQLSALTQPART